MATATTIPTVTLGQAVTYVGTKGLPKAAFVVGTQETVEEGHSLPTLNEGQLHIVVWEFSKGHFTPRTSVPFEGQIADNTEFQNEDGNTVAFWRLS